MTVTFDTSKLKQDLAKLMNDVLLPSAGETILSKITERNNKGIDANGEVFDNYTPQYAKYGRAALGYTVNPVTLKRKGDYERARFYNPEARELQVKDSQKPKAEGLQAKRLNFAGSTTDIPVIEQNMAKGVKAKYE